jgi:hypothetical protein
MYWLFAFLVAILLNRDWLCGASLLFDNWRIYSLPFALQVSIQ